MSTNPMSFALPEAMRSYCDQRASSGQYGNTSEYLRELIAESLNSATGQEVTPQRAAHLKKQALGKPRWSARTCARRRSDLLEATGPHAGEGSVEGIERMFDAAIAALEAIERMSGMVSTRLGRHCEIPDLRSWRITCFPMRWLYFEAADLDVVRLLGDRQDVVDILNADA